MGGFRDDCDEFMQRVAPRPMLVGLPVERGIPRQSGDDCMTVRPAELVAADVAPAETPLNQRRLKPLRMFVVEVDQADDFGRSIPDASPHAFASSRNFS